MTRAQLSQVWSVPDTVLAADAQRLAERENADERPVRGWVLLVLVVGLVVLGWVA